MKPTWDPAYAALRARRAVGLKAVGRTAINAAYRKRQALAALCDCDGLDADAATHREWCCYRASAEKPAPVYTCPGPHPANCACERCAREKR